jgi:hypothetical protein
VPRFPCSLHKRISLPYRVPRTLTVLSFVALFSAAVIAQEPGPFPPPKTEPPVITPGKNNSDPPSDAIVLFNGQDLSHWQAGDGPAAKWK